MLQDYDFYIVTWKVVSLINKGGMLQQVIKELYEGRLISNAHSEVSRKRDHVFKPNESKK